jgi:methionyl-tRNA synthetase
MSENSTKYITTTLPYVNAEPHIGHSLEFLQADCLARYWRLMGHEVFFNTGTDEHGQKIADKADAADTDYQVYVDHYAAEFDKLKAALNLSYDSFIRTTDETHKAAAQEIWRRCKENGYIDKKVYAGLYCIGDEMFVRENDLVDGRCPNHPDQEPIELEEENYYFKLSEFEDYLLDYFADESVIIPTWQRQWAIDFVKAGLGDLSISRPKKRMSWGVPVPDDDEHVMYVWFDALTNYISCLGWPETGAESNFTKYWVNGETLQLAGKDQVRFQSIIWQAMLKAAGLPATNRIFYHGFVNIEGQKISKSVGNVISPYEMIERYGTDATRYLLLRHVHPTEDSDVSWEKFDEWYTAHLVNGLGNLVARVTKMAESYGAFPAEISTPDWLSTHSTVSNYLDKFDFQNALNGVWEKIGQVDTRIQETQPFKLIKTDEAKAVALVRSMVEDVYLIACAIEPFMPATSQLITAAIVAHKKPENLFARLER